MGIQILKPLTDDYGNLIPVHHLTYPAYMARYNYFHSF